jgi:hypothetical protein
MPERGRIGVPPASPREASSDGASLTPAPLSAPSLADELRYAWEAFPAVRWTAAILSVVVVALLGWLLLIRPGESNAIREGGGAVATSRADLTSLAGQLGHPVYWAGGRSGMELEATLTEEGLAFVRYLPSGTPVGASSPDFLTVGTYPVINALADLRAYARQGHASPKPVDGGGIAVSVPGSPTSAFFAMPDQDLQVEVYDPTPGHALELIRSGAIEPA